ncbi:MAG: Gfo/Idh/MocA family protein [Bacillota bacterium]
MGNGRVKVGLIGCGNISATYLKNGKEFREFEIVACADLIPERAHACAAQFGVPRALAVSELLADPEIEVVLNLTVPAVHAEIALAAIAAGKSVFNEKPLAVTLTDGRQVLEAARARGVRVGCAPDTFLGAGLQTCRYLIDQGEIGTPLAATAFMMGSGPESWHPDPEFFYKAGAGPMFDMGPYYLTALITMLGPASRVTGSARISRPERTITSSARYGQKIKVETPTHVSGLIDFAAGPVATIITSFDVWRSQLPRIEIYGSAGVLSVPDPNHFGGPVRLLRAGQQEWQEVGLTHGSSSNSRGMGLADMCAALRAGRPHRASGDLALHVLEIMHAIHEASAEGRHVGLTTSCERPAGLPAGLPDFTVAWEVE